MLRLEDKIKNQRKEISKLAVRILNLKKHNKRGSIQIKKLKQEIETLKKIKGKRIDENKPNDQKDAYNDDFTEVTKEIRKALNSPENNRARDRLTARVIALQNQVDSLTQQLKNCTCKNAEVEDLD